MRFVQQATKMRFLFSANSRSINFRAVLLIAPIAIATVLGLPLHTGFSGDDVNFALHLVSLYADSIHRGQILPGWVPTGNDGWGSPVFYFYGLIPSLFAGSLSLLLHTSPAVALSLTLAFFSSYRVLHLPPLVTTTHQIRPR